MTPSAAVVDVEAPGGEHFKSMCRSWNLFICGQQDLQLPFNQLLPAAFVQLCFSTAVLTDWELRVEQIYLFLLHSSLRQDFRKYSPQSKTNNPGGSMRRRLLPAEAAQEVQLLQDDSQTHGGQKVCCFFQSRVNRVVEIGLDTCRGSRFYSPKPLYAEHV